MLKKICSFLVALICYSQIVYAFPDLTGQVVDNANILSEVQEQQLTQTLQKANPHQVVAVSLDSLEGKEIEEYGVALSRHWGIGQKGINDGVLVLIAPNHRQMRIEVGYGLEGELTDAKCSRIINRIMLPLAKEGKYDEALIQGSEAVVGIFSGTIKHRKISKHEDPSKDIFFVNIMKTIGFLCEMVICIFFIAIFIIIRLIIKKITSIPEIKSQKEIKKIILNCKIPQTLLEKKISQKDRLKFFLVAIPWILTLTPFVLIGICGLKDISSDLLPNLIFVFFFSGIPAYILIIYLGAMIEIWKKNPYFPYYEMKQPYNGSGFRKRWLSHIGTGNSSHTNHGGSSGSSFHGGGGSFGGGGSSGRW